MKTITCKQFGGPCDAVISGSTADELIKKGADHLQDMVQKGDKSHQPAFDMMTGMQKNPASGKDWYEKFKKDFESLPGN